MSLHKYPEYKVTDSKLVAEVPKDWQLVPLRRLLPLIESGTSVNALDNQPEEGKPSVLKTSCVYTSRFRREECKEIVEEELGRATCPVKKDSLIVSRMNTPDLVGAAGLADSDIDHLYLPDRLWQVRIKELLPAFAYYWTQSKLYRDQVKATCSGTSSSMQNLSQEAFVSFFLCRPDSGEQNLIASFLDRETAKIDALIAEQQRLIELLHEKRQAVISHAVTKGLNPNAPIKDSGVEWLGKVPEHWVVVEARREIDFLTSGSRGWAEFYSDNGYLFLRIGNLTRDSIDLDLEDIQRVSPPEGAEGARTEVREGDVLFSITAYLGSVAVVPQDLERAYVSQHVCLVRLNGRNLLPKWLAYAVLSVSGRAYLEAESYGGTKVQLSLDDIKSFPLAIPPLEEQRPIIDSLEDSLAGLKGLWSDCEESIALLQERRSALISAAVTGQIDVRGLVPEVSAA
jgi:type I restriction enzyme S subunit